MVNKRGLSPSEYDVLDPDLLEALMVFDSYIEPSGVKIDMLFHAQKCYTDAIMSGNLSDSFRKSLKVSDFDFLEVLDGENITQKERLEKRTKDAEEKQNNDIKMLGEQIKKMALGKKNNGK